MGPHQSVGADVEHLLGHPLAHLAAVGRNADERGDRRRQGAPLQDLPAVQHVLEAVPEIVDVVGMVLGLEDHPVVGRGGQRDGPLNRRRGDKRGHGGAPLLESADNAVQSRHGRHARLLVVREE